MRLTTIALLTSIVCPLSIFAATTQKIVSTNQVLEQVAIQSDKDVLAVTAVNGLLKAKTVTNDLESLVNDLNQAFAADQGITPTSDPGTEDTVTDSFNQFTNALVQFLSDLVNKKNLLTLYGQKSAIYNQLQYLNQAYVTYAGLVIGDLGDQDHKNEVSEFTETGSGKIVTATQVYRS